MTKSKLKKYDPPTITIEVKSNWFIEVDDYHEFSPILHNFKKIIKNVDYEELGVDDFGTYVALFWIGDKPVELIETLKKSYED